MRFYQWLKRYDGGGPAQYVAHTAANDPRWPKTYTVYAGLLSYVRSAHGQEVVDDLPKAWAEYVADGGPRAVGRNRPVETTCGRWFPSAGAAAAALVAEGVPSAARGNITECCRFRRQMAYGYSWQYAGDDLV